MTFVLFLYTSCHVISFAPAHVYENIQGICAPSPPLCIFWVRPCTATIYTAQCFYPLIVPVENGFGTMVSYLVAVDVKPH